MPSPLQPLLKLLHLGGWPVYMGDADTAHKQANALERVDEAEHVQIIGDAVITADLAADRCPPR